MPGAVLAADAIGDSVALRQEIDAHGGSVSEASGDSLLAAFESAAAALHAALGMQKQPESSTPGRTRIGIHVGDAAVAMGLRATAMPGGICISQALYDVVRDKAVFQAQFGGKKTFKNTREPMGIWHVADVNVELHLPDSTAPAAAPAHMLHRLLPFAVIAAMILGGAVAWWWIAHVSKEAAHVSQAVYSRPCAS
jgi:adenylate cyclase